jgi:hypothetical protein
MVFRRTHQNNPAMTLVNITMARTDRTDTRMSCRPGGSAHAVSIVETCRGTASVIRFDRLLGRNRRRASDDRRLIRNPLKPLLRGMPFLEGDA